MEALGAEVLPLAADVADYEDMQEVISQAEQHFGDINGVIHAAGVMAKKSFSAIQELQKEDCEEQFQVKVQPLLSVMTQVELVLLAKDVVRLISVLMIMLELVGEHTPQYRVL